MNAKVYDLEGRETSNVDLPPVFNFPYRPEVIKKVYVKNGQFAYFISKPSFSFLNYMTVK